MNSYVDKANFKVMFLKKRQNGLNTFPQKPHTEKTIFKDENTQNCNLTKNN